MSVIRSRIFVTVLSATLATTIALPAFAVDPSSVEPNDVYYIHRTLGENRRVLIVSRLPDGRFKVRDEQGAIDYVDASQLQTRTQSDNADATDTMIGIGLGAAVIAGIFGNNGNHQSPPPQQPRRATATQVAVLDDYASRMNQATSRAVAEGIRFDSASRIGITLHVHYTVLNDYVDSARSLPQSDWQKIAETRARSDCSNQFTRSVLDASGLIEYDYFDEADKGIEYLTISRANCT